MSNDAKEEEEEEESHLQPLSWMGDPEVTLSDWTVVVIPEDDEAGDDDNASLSRTYHVHKVILGVGPRSSKYFARLFRSRLAESKTATSTIRMQPQAAAAFPDLFNYIYGIACDFREELDHNLPPCRAVSLKYLADYFEVPALAATLSNLIDGAIAKTNLVAYLEQALVFHDSQIIERTKQIALENWTDVLAVRDEKISLESNVEENFEDDDGRFRDAEDEESIDPDADETARAGFDQASGDNLDDKKDQEEAPPTDFAPFLKLLPVEERVELLQQALNIAAEQHAQAANRVAAAVASAGLNHANNIGFVRYDPPSVSPRAPYFGSYGGAARFGPQQHRQQPNGSANGAMDPIFRFNLSHSHAHDTNNHGRTNVHQNRRL